MPARRPKRKTHHRKPPQHRTGQQLSGWVTKSVVEEVDELAKAFRGNRSMCLEYLVKMALPQLRARLTESGSLLSQV